MGGIAGRYGLDGAPGAGAALQRMCAALSHRSPDGVDTWVGDAVAMAHLRLHTTPEAVTAVQPVRSHAGAGVLVADVRVDNREELCQALGCGRDGRTVHDAEILSLVLEAWGAPGLERVYGDFALAHWDARERKLICARDAFGVKPLYYAYVPGRCFAFATEIKALLELEDVSRAIDDEEVARHLLLPVEDDETATIYRSVRRVPPGHFLVVSPTGLRTSAYWSLDPSPAVWFPDDASYAEAFRAHFVEAVRTRLRSPAPVASMLSGGLDSSSVTCVAAREATGPVHTLSGRFDGVPGSDERAYMQAVLDAYPLRAHSFRADRVNPFRDAEQIMWYVDGPSPAGNLYINWRLFAIARSEGVRVVLDGFDGDTTVSHGLGLLTELARAGRWLRLLREVRAFSPSTGESWPRAYAAWVRRYAWAGRRTASTGVPAAGHACRQAVWEPALQPAFARLAARRRTLPVPYPETERERHHRLLVRPVLARTLELLDAAAGAYGLEVRFPFFDRRLVSFCLALPPDQKLRLGWSRWVLRTGMEGYLPEAVRWRPGKSNLGPGFDHILRAYAGGSVRRLLAAEESPIDRYLTPAGRRTTVERYLAGTASGAEQVSLWRALTLESWLRHGATRAGQSSESRWEQSLSRAATPGSVADPGGDGVVAERSPHH